MNRTGKMICSFAAILVFFNTIPLSASTESREEYPDEPTGVLRTVNPAYRASREILNAPSPDESPFTAESSATTALKPLPSRQTHQGPQVYTEAPPETERTEHYIELFSSEKYTEWVTGVYKRSRDFIPFIKSIIAEHDVPPEIAWLPAVESAFRSHAVSSSGAAGLWQFMRNSISPYDITIDQWRDERRDFVKATRGAIRKLEYNYEKLGDWYLALAAYNCGLGRVQRTVESTGIRDYWQLSEKGLLPIETMEYIPRFIAAAGIFSYPGRYGIPLNWEKPVIWDIIDLDQAVDLRILAEKTGIPLEIILSGNSELRYGITPPSSFQYALKVPAEYSDSIREVLENDDQKLIRFYIHQISSGDTFYGLGRHFQVPVEMIMEYNSGVDPSKLRIGQKIIIPAFREVGPYRGNSGSIAEDYKGVYLVSAGDSLWSISRNFGITPEELARNNGLDLNGILKQGIRLQVPRQGEEN